MCALSRTDGVSILTTCLLLPSETVEDSTHPHTKKKVKPQRKIFFRHQSKGISVMTRLGLCRMTGPKQEANPNLVLGPWWHTGPFCQQRPKMVRKVRGLASRWATMHMLRLSAVWT